MKSVVIFNQEQQDSFKAICEDFGGPTSTRYLLEVIERVLVDLDAFSCGDSLEFSSKDLNEEVEVLLAALEHARCLDVVGR